MSQTSRNTENIANYKEKLGFSRNIDNLALIESISKSEWLLGSTIAALKDKLYVVSFEDNGILFMGVNKLYQFNGDHKFIEFNQFGTVEYKKTKWFNSRLVLNGEKLTITSLDGSRDEFLMYTFIAIIGWVKNDLINVHHKIDSYPSLNEKMTSKKEQTDHIENNFSSIQELRELKSLLDEDIITEEEFKTKKKQILDI